MMFRIPIRPLQQVGSGDALRGCSHEVWRGGAPRELRRIRARAELVSGVRGNGLRRHLCKRASTPANHQGYPAATGLEWHILNPCAPAAARTSSSRLACSPPESWRRRSLAMPLRSTRRLVSPRTTLSVASFATARPRRQAATHAALRAAMRTEPRVPIMRAQKRSEMRLRSSPDRRHGVRRAGLSADDAGGFDP